MPKAKVLGYEDQNYNQKKDTYASLKQVFEDLKYDLTHKKGWNTPVDQIEGITMRFINNQYLELTHHSFETTTVEGLARLEDGKCKFIEEFMKELKKYFKKHTSQALKVKKIKQDRSIEKASKVQSETSWMFGANQYGHGSRPVGRYLIRDSVVYDFNTSLEDED